MLAFASPQSPSPPAQAPRRARALALTALMITALAVVTRPGFCQTVDATITTDNAYSFGYGTLGGLSSLFGGIENCTAGEIFNCSGGAETYLGVPAPAGQYLYVIGYSDGAVTQGVLAQFVSGTQTVSSGQVSWEVFATGDDIEPNCGGPSNSPSLATINAQIALANSNSGGTNSSVGWVGITGGSSGTIGALAIGEDNSSSSGDFPIVCNIASGAKWMWYTPDPSTVTNAFVAGPVPNLPSDVIEFLIFRLASEVVTPVPSPTWGRVKTLYR